jgi:hypothetical protein
MAIIVQFSLKIIILTFCYKFISFVFHILPVLIPESSAKNELNTDTHTKV